MNQWTGRPVTDGICGNIAESADKACVMSRLVQ